MDLLSGLSIFTTVWFGLWVIPAAIMDAETRQLSSLVNVKTVWYLLLMILMNIVVVLPEAGLSAAAGLKVLLLSLLPFASAYMMVRYYYSVGR